MLRVALAPVTTFQFSITYHSTLPLVRGFRRARKDESDIYECSRLFSHYQLAIGSAQRVAMPSRLHEPSHYYGAPGDAAPPQRERAETAHANAAVIDTLHTQAAIDAGAAPVTGQPQWPATPMHAQRHYRRTGDRICHIQDTSSHAG